MRVLHVIPSIAACRGGASKAAIDMVAALGTIGVQVEIACTNDNGPSDLDVPLGQLVEYAGVPVRFFARWSRGPQSLREFAYSTSLREWLRRNIENYDIVHVHALFSFASTYTMWLARKRKVNYIAHPIGSLEKWSLEQSSIRKRIYLKLFERANLNGAARVHFTAQSEQQQALESVPDLRPVMIPLGLDLPILPTDAAEQLKLQFNLPQDSKVVLFLGRLHPKKGLEVLIQAMQRQKDDVHLLIAGSGALDYVSSLKEQIQQNSLSEKVTMVGYLQGEQKSLALAGADLFVLISHSENFGVAVLESLAFGTAVLVSQGVALSQQIAENRLGSVTSMEIKEVAEKLDALLRNEVELSEAGGRGRKYVAARHDWKMLAAQLYETYQEIARHR